jgi:hypothetical protein
MPGLSGIAHARLEDDEDEARVTVTRPALKHPGMTQANTRPLTALLNIRLGPGCDADSPCSWSLGVLDPAATADLEAAAWVLADLAMAYRCGRSPALSLWRARAQGGPELTVGERRIVEAFLVGAFGLPEAPAPANHVQGYVAELLWYSPGRGQGRSSSGHGGLSVPTRRGHAQARLPLPTGCRARSAGPRTQSPPSG